MTKKLEAKYLFRSAAMLLYINKISVTEVSYFFLISRSYTGLHACYK
jgi:hypothetical protein